MNVPKSKSNNMKEIYGKEFFSQIIINAFKKIKDYQNCL